MKSFENIKIAVAGTGYVGLSIATLLSQHHQVTAVDVIPEKVEKLNKKISPIQDDYIEKYLSEKDLDLNAVLFPGYLPRGRRSDTRGESQLGDGAPGDSAQTDRSDRLWWVLKTCHTVSGFYRLCGERVQRVPRTVRKY